MKTGEIGGAKTHQHQEEVNAVFNIARNRFYRTHNHSEPKTGKSYKKICMEWVQNNGIELLVDVPKPSIGKLI